MFRYVSINCVDIWLFMNKPDREHEENILKELENITET